MLSEVSSPEEASSHQGRVSSVFRRFWTRASSAPAAPLTVLALVSVVSVGSRVLWLASPRLLIFDEHYYVNAARVILGLEASPFYAKSTPGKDPNREHPPLGKLALAGSIRAFGDGPVGWRLPSVAFGSLAILAMYGLVRSVGGSRWLGVGASSLMAADTLFFVQGRVGMLDIFVLTFMLLGSALYLGGRPIPAGVVLGIGASTKLVGLYALFPLLLFEVLRLVFRRFPPPPRGRPTIGARLRAFMLCAVAALVSYLGLLYALDLAVTDYKNPLAHTGYMISFHERLAVKGGHTPASPPWSWLVNREPLFYLKVKLSPGESARGPSISVRPQRTPLFFQGVMNPAIIGLGVPALAAACYSVWRRRDPASLLAVAWFLGTWLPFLAMAWRLPDRPLYLFYMLVVLPGVYLAVAQFFSGRYLSRIYTVGYAVAVVLGFWYEFPFKTWGGI